MKPTPVLRATSVLSLLLALGHTLGGRKSWSPIGETDVLHAMRSFRFEVAGVSRTYLDFYLGFGFLLSVYLVLQAALLWQLAAIARTEPLRARPLIASFLLASVASAVLSWVFLFAIPAISSALIAVCLGFAFYVASK